jgi:hypothetical protein
MISSTTRKTMRTISNSVWHLISQIQIQKPEKNIKQKKQKKQKKLPVVCPITECVIKHKAIQKELGLDAALDIFVSHILAMDILVPKVALETNVSVFRGDLQNIPRQSLPKDLDP